MSPLAQSTSPPDCTPLTSDDDTTLVRRWQHAGDRMARDRLTARYTPLVQRLARSFSARGLDVADLLQEGFGGLLIAIARYRPGGEATLADYAFYRVRLAMLAALRSHATAGIEDGSWSLDDRRRRHQARNIVAAGASFEDQLIAAEDERQRCRDLERALVALDSGQRQVIEARLRPGARPSGRWTCAASRRGHSARCYRSSAETGAICSSADAA